MKLKIYDGVLAHKSIGAEGAQCCPKTFAQVQVWLERIGRYDCG